MAAQEGGAVKVPTSTHLHTTLHTTPASPASSSLETKYRIDKSWGHANSQAKTNIQIQMKIQTNSDIDGNTIQSIDAMYIRRTLDTADQSQFWEPD